MLLHTATEEIGHIEMLATAVALNLETAPASLQQDGASDGIVGTVMGGGSAKASIEGLIHKNLLSGGLAAMPMDSDGVAFNMSHIARDTMHQQQWLAVLEELGGASANLPIPNSFPQEMEDGDNNYNFYATAVDGSVPEGRWTSGPSIDGRGDFTVFPNQPLGDEPVLGPARPGSGAQDRQIG